MQQVTAVPTPPCIPPCKDCPVAQRSPAPKASGHGAGGLAGSLGRAAQPVGPVGLPHRGTLPGQTPGREIPDERE